ncbi:CDP-glucose 4,6-dehydratase [Lachnospiraceae bacterium ZAX-1]
MNMNARKNDTSSIHNSELRFFNDKTVFITGHNGFKGSWMCKVLSMAGANIIGYSLNPPTEPNLFSTINCPNIVSIFGDIRDFETLNSAILRYKPEIIIHMAAQPIVRESYKDPITTYSTNVMGTVNILEAARHCESVKSVLNVTTDKVYENLEWEWGYRETDRLNGIDPYSNSKSCSELITDAYKRAFLSEIAVSTCRAGNVIGGGDFAVDRIVPDCVRAITKCEDILIRNPHSVRAYQHVLEVVFAYLMVVERQFNDKGYESCYNIGPNEEGCISTERLVRIFCEKWGGSAGWKIAVQKNAPYESNYLRLDCSRIKNVFHWSALWDITQAIEKTVEWSKGFSQKADVAEIMERQICEYKDLYS